MPLASSSSRSEIRDHLDYSIKTIEQHSGLDSLPPPAKPSFASIAAKLRDLLNRYEDPFRLAVVGEFNAGKSTLINALLGWPNLVPEGATATTGALTELWWGEQESGEVFSGDDRSLFRGSIADAAKFADQRTPHGKSISGRRARIVLRVPCDFLMRLVLIDTPGPGANATDDEVTFESLELADAAILVVNGLQPGADESLRLTEWLRTSRRKMITVITRMDLVTVPDAAVDAARELFGMYSEGDLIRVSSPLIRNGHAALRAAIDRDDAAGIAAAEQMLRDGGYIELYDRLQTMLAGQASIDRAWRTLTDVGTQLNELAEQAVKRAAASEKAATAIAGELSAVEQRINEVLRPKIPYLEGKIDQIVDAHVAEMVDHMGEALDVFVDQVFHGNLGLKLEALLSRFSADDDARLQRKLQNAFKDVFPDEQVKIVVAAIGRAVRSLLELEWSHIASNAVSVDARNFDPSALIARLTSHLTAAAAALTAETAAWIVLLFIPGGALVDVALLILSVGFGIKLVKKGPEKLAAIKRDAKVRLRTARRTLGHKIAEHFRQLNRDTADELIGAARASSSAKQRIHQEALDTAKRWQIANDALKSLIDVSDELAKDLK